MNKSELVSYIAEIADIPKSSAEKALNAFIETVTDALSEEEQVILVGFGTFSTRKRGARNGRNPQTGETMHIDAVTVPSFKAGKALKDAVNK